MPPVVQAGQAVDAGKPLERIGLLREFADVTVSQKPPAVWQRLASELDDLAIGKLDVERPVLAGSDQIHLPGDIIA